MTQKSEWQILFYTCDCEGNFMRLGGKIVLRDGNETISGAEIFHGNGGLFDIKLTENGEITKKCWVESIDCGANAQAITPDGKTIKLKHKALLRTNPDKKAWKKMKRLALKVECAKNIAGKIEELEYHRKTLIAELKKVDTNLSKLKGKLK
ncbi:hypothetical protein KKB41_01105 [Patescibacteria group bacterium]|nr:hypothetical protein [Patescibacteria group bacterium]